MTYCYNCSAAGHSTYSCNKPINYAALHSKLEGKYKAAEAEVRALRASAYEERKEAMRDYQRLNKELAVRCEEIAALRAEVEGLKHKLKLETADFETAKAGAQALAAYRAHVGGKDG